MAWVAYVVVVVRGPLRDVDLFRHQFRAFWAAHEYHGPRRAWMRTIRRPPPHADRHHWWLPSPLGPARGPDSPTQPEPRPLQQLRELQRAGEEEYQRGTTATIGGPEALAILAARQYAEALCVDYQTFLVGVRKLSHDLCELILRDALPLPLLASLRQRLTSTLAGEDEEERAGEEVELVRWLLSTLDRTVGGFVGELVYEATLRKELLHRTLPHLARAFPRLTITHLAQDEWGDQNVAVSYQEGVGVDLGADAPFGSLWGRLRIIEEADLGVDDWEAFSFDVTDRDFEFQWGVNQPCECCSWRSTAEGRTQ